MTKRSSQWRSCFWNVSASLQFFCLMILRFSHGLFSVSRRQPKQGYLSKKLTVTPNESTVDWRRGSHQRDDYDYIQVNVFRLFRFVENIVQFVVKRLTVAKLWLKFRTQACKTISISWYWTRLCIGTRSHHMVRYHIQPPPGSAILDRINDGARANRNERKRTRGDEIRHFCGWWSR